MDSIYKELDILERTLEGNEKPNNISLSVLKYITNDFSNDRKIANGGCGDVYKGILRNGTVAVKKLFNKHTVTDKQFNREVQSMMRVEHENIVRLIGYCSHTEVKALQYEGRYIMAEMRERLLCSEYISNGSLDRHLTDELRGLKWCTRYQITKGICEGLHHLHKEGIIHMDLKPANILLDNHMVPKITDFGLSRLDDVSQTASNERLLSIGYCAPEYKLEGKMSLKSDIFSLGVIIMELVTGRKEEEPDITNVHRRWRHRWKKSSKHTLMAYQQLTTCTKLAFKCMDKNPLERPFIWDIIDTLNQIENINSNETTVDQITSGLEDMLGIEPLELHFPFQPDMKISCSLQLTNDTDGYFAFRILTRSPLRYCIQPMNGVVPRRSKYSVTITLRAQEQAPEHQNSAEFCVQSTRLVEGGLTANNITKDMFSEKTGKVVDMVDLTVAFDAMPEVDKHRASSVAAAAPSGHPVRNPRIGTSSNNSETPDAVEVEELLLKMNAKLYRFEKEGNQWKERGAGTVKLLKHKETTKVRLVMREAKTLKICANHLVVETTKMQEHAGSDKSCVWHALDVADGELKEELFAIHFISVENCKKFMDTVEEIAEQQRKNEKEKE